MDFPPVLRGQPRQVEHADQRTLDAANLAGDLQQPPALRHFARTGVLAARGAVDDQDARRLRGVFMLRLRLLDRFMRGAPVVGEVVIGVGELRPGLVRARRLAVVGIAVPGDAGDAVELGLQRLERRDR